MSENFMFSAHVQRTAGGKHMRVTDRTFELMPNSLTVCNVLDFSTGKANRNMMNI